MIHLILNIVCVLGVVFTLLMTFSLMFFGANSFSQWIANQCNKRNVPVWLMISIGGFGLLCMIEMLVRIVVS